MWLVIFKYQRYLLNVCKNIRPKWIRYKLFAGLEWMYLSFSSFKLLQIKMVHMLVINILMSASTRSETDNSLKFQVIVNVIFAVFSDLNIF